MFLNTAKQPQSVMDRGNFYQVLYPGEVVDEQLYPAVKDIRVFKKIKKLDLRKHKSVLLKRGHALGDVIMTFPLMNYLRSLGKDVCIKVNTRYEIRGVDFISGKVPFDYSQFDLILNLDGVSEKDHSDPKLYQLNRVDIYNKFLNFKNIGNNWNVTYPNVDVDLQGAIVGIQIGGSQDYKSIDLHPLMKRLDEQGIKFYIIDNVASVYSYKNQVCIPTDILGLLNIFSRLKGILSFDSSPLWLSHVTNTPVFVIVGPTSGKKIIARHPNSKTVFYDTKSDFKCKLKYGCGESALNCNKQYSCLKNVNQERLTNQFITWLEDL